MSPVWTYVLAGLALLIAGASVALGLKVCSQLLTLEAALAELLAVHSFRGTGHTEAECSGPGRHRVQGTPDTSA